LPYPSRDRDFPSLQSASGLDGLAAITLKKIFLTGFSEGQGLTGLVTHLGREWVVLANLFLLLRPHKEQAQRIERSHE
jgi:hypothetical protein